jgi:phage shock protein C
MWPGAPHVILEVMSEPVPGEGQAVTVSGPTTEPDPETGPGPPPMTSTQGRGLLRRSRTDRVIAGVCGGLGRYLGVDPVLIRIATLVLVFVGGAGVILYLIGWIAIPEEELDPAVPGVERAAPGSHQGRVFVGFLFVGLGLFYLLDELFPGVDLLRLRYLGPVILIAVGIGVIARTRT